MSVVPCLAQGPTPLPPEPGALRLVHPDPLGPVLDALATPTPAVMRDARRWLDHLSAMAHEAAVVALSPVTAPATRAREVATGRRELGLLLDLWAAVDALPDASLAGLTVGTTPRRYLARLVAAANAAAYALDLAAAATDPSPRSGRVVSGKQEMPTYESLDINGYTMLAINNGGEVTHKITDTALATRLGYTQVRDIRKIIKRYIKSGDLQGVETRATVARVDRQGRGAVTIKSVEHLLDEEQALFIIAKSDAALANQITREVIRVFVLVKSGHLGQSDIASAMVGLAATVRELAGVQQAVSARMTTLEERLSSFYGDHKRAHGEAAIGDTIATARIKLPIIAAARDKAKYLGGRKAESSYNRQFHISVRVACNGFAGPWEKLPRGLLDNAEVAIANIVKGVRDDARRVERGGYLPEQLAMDLTDRPRRGGKGQRRGKRS